MTHQNSLIRFLLSHLFKKKGLFLFGFTCLLIGSISQIFQTYFIKLIIDAATYTQETGLGKDQLFKVFLGFAACRCTVWIAWHAFRYIYTRLEPHLQKSIKKTMFNHIQKHSLHLSESVGLNYPVVSVNAYRLHALFCKMLLFLF